MNYYIEDFTEDNYKKLLRIVQKRSYFTSYEECIRTGGVVWRHDIDISVNRALALCQLEKELGVKAYYFVYLHSLFYSALEKEIAQMLKIISKSAIIGLHFDPSFYSLSTEDIGRVEQKILFEKNILESILEVEITHMSFHNPDVGGNWHLLPYERIGGLFNVYGDNVRNNLMYCSDSNGYWRYQRLENVLINLDSSSRLQVLTHPVWWQENSMYPYERIERCAKGRMEKSLGNYKSDLEKCNRVNVTREKMYDRN